MKASNAQVLWQVMEALRDANQLEDALSALSLELLFAVIINSIVFRKVKKLNLRDIA